MEGNKAGVDEQGIFSESPGEKESLPAVEEEMSNLEKYREFVRTCREKIRKAKVQLELNLATGVKGKKIFLTNISTVRGGLRIISILHWM